MVPHSVCEIEAEAFANWKHLRQIIFAEDSSLVRIGAKAFYGSGLEAFIAPNHLKVIESLAFSGCKNMKTVDLDHNLEAIASDCFEGSGLTTLKISTKSINSAAYLLQGCDKIDTVEFKEGS